MAVCLISITSSAIVTGNYPDALKTDEAMIGAFFIVFPAIVSSRCCSSRESEKSNSPKPLSNSRRRRNAPVAHDVAAGFGKRTDDHHAADSTDTACTTVSVEAGIAVLGTRLAGMACRRAQRRRENFGTFLAGIAGLFIFAAVILSLSLAFDIPGMIASGFPDGKLAEELQTKVFVGVSDWPKLLTKIATASLIILLMLGLVVMLWARRGDGVGTLVRSVIGAIGMVFAASPLNEAFRYSGTWQIVAAFAHKKEFGSATEAFTNQLQGARQSHQRRCFSFSWSCLRGLRRAASAARRPVAVAIAADCADVGKKA